MKSALYIFSSAGV